jgi:hypothetical protein
MNKFIICLVLWAGFCCINLPAENIRISGQASLWVQSAGELQLGARYIPRADVFLAEGIDGEISFKAAGWAQADEFDDFCDNADAGLYRAWIRYKSSQLEVRSGLQKINFGPAKYLRSLMWFDSLDTRDPLSLTGGMYGVLGRFYFLNNNNAWLWVLYGNDDLKGLETVKTDSERAEFGGRFQVRAISGELALSYNHRYVDRSNWEAVMAEEVLNGEENRIALDGIWDVGPGLWFEASAGAVETVSGEFSWNKSVTFGSDYTLGIGPGIHVLLEHFINASGSCICEYKDVYKLWAVSADFSISMLDRMELTGYYEPESANLYSYAAWSRTYDNWIFNISVFSERDNSSGLYAGDGVQFLAAYNH